MSRRASEPKNATQALQAIEHYGHELRCAGLNGQRIGPADAKEMGIVIAEAVALLRVALAKHDAAEYMAEKLKEDLPALVVAFFNGQPVKKKGQP